MRREGTTVTYVCESCGSEYSSDEQSGGAIRTVTVQTGVVVDATFDACSASHCLGHMLTELLAHGRETVRRHEQATGTSAAARFLC